MDIYNISNAALTEIAGFVKKYLNGNISTSAIKTYDRYDSFSRLSNLSNEPISIQYYRENNRFTGHINNGGHFSGTISDMNISIICSQTGRHVTISK